MHAISTGFSYTARGMQENNLTVSMERVENVFFYIQTTLGQACRAAVSTAHFADLRVPWEVSVRSVLLDAVLEKTPT